ncbi:hypothetical protein AKJ40_00850 [candidate division MSBL1 archaeon SCGC-AAA259M10]|uniref:Uncharacterized protein n=1 Tax=candidate division MSBL1 archaeon SCGC-AAA259M10 TaxID=1698270 RepID=A0A133V2M4_9EURY|nr:hypothetical protein AKJ40_00850 [candidate division MSBL1 archaeon SCGC-AAA259M10]
MPTREEHVEHCEELYGHGFEEIHEWMDGTVVSKGRGHREDRHDPGETPDKAYEIFEDKVPGDKKKFIKDAVKDHIELDMRSSGRKSQKKKLSEAERAALAEEVRKTVIGSLDDGECPYWIINQFYSSEKRDIAREILHEEGFCAEELKGTKKGAVKGAIRRIVEEGREPFVLFDLRVRMTKEGVPYYTYDSRLSAFLKEIVPEMGGEIFPARSSHLFLIVPPKAIPNQQSFSRKIKRVFGASEGIESNPYRAHLHNASEAVLGWVKERVEKDLEGFYPPEIPRKDRYPNFSGVAKAILYHKGFSESEIEKVEVYDKIRDRSDRRRWIIESILLTTPEPLPVSGIIDRFEERTDATITREYVEHVIRQGYGEAVGAQGGVKHFLDRGNPVFGKWKSGLGIIERKRGELQ